jgi:CheY-like chemotaxis protein
MPRKLKVVVAHHEKVIADTLASVVEHANVDAKTAYSGVAAVELVLSTKPDLALLCIVPAHPADLNGVYAAVLVRTLMPACRIVLCAGSSGWWVTEPLALAKARGYEFEVIPEPIQPEILFELVAGMGVGDIEPTRSIFEAQAKITEFKQEDAPLERRPDRRRAMWKFFKKSRRSE